MVRAKAKAKVKAKAKTIEPQRSIRDMEGLQEDLSSLVVGLMDQNAELLQRLERMESLVHESEERAKAEAEKINTRALERAERIIAKAKEKAEEGSQKKMAMAEKRAQAIISAAEEEASRIIVAAQMIAEEEEPPEKAGVEIISESQSAEPEAVACVQRDLNKYAVGQEGVQKEGSPAAPHDSTVGFSITFPRTAEQLLKMPSRLKNLLKSRSWN